MSSFLQVRCLVGQPERRLVMAGSQTIVIYVSVGFGLETMTLGPELYDRDKIRSWCGVMASHSYIIACLDIAATCAVYCLQIYGKRLGSSIVACDGCILSTKVRQVLVFPLRLCPVAESKLHTQDTSRIS